jgi:hypothetical protein
MTGEAKRLLGGYATDTLSEVERRELLRAALDDQELFDALLEQDGLRELLEAPGARQEVLEVLDRPGRWERVRTRFARPATFADLAALAAVLTLGLATHFAFRGPAPGEVGHGAAARPRAAAVPALALARLLALPPRQVVPAGLEFEGRREDEPVSVRPGEALALRVSLRAPARLLVVAEGPDGALAQVVPPAGEPPAFVAPPPQGGPAVRRVTLRAGGVGGTHRLRLVVAPVDLDLAAASPADLTLVDLSYEVIAP